VSCEQDPFEYLVSTQFHFWLNLCPNISQPLPTSYPRAAMVILNSTHMDDNMASVLTTNEAIGLYQELSELWGEVGMRTHKWLSNSTKVLENIPQGS